VASQTRQSVAGHRAKDAFLARVRGVVIEGTR
jgi:hypothetical protein